MVAVYSRTQGANWPLDSFHTERVHARCVPVCEGLVLPLHTGLADWQTVSPAPAGPVVVLQGLNQGWDDPPSGASYVGLAILARFHELHSPGNEDQMSLHLVNIVKARMGVRAMTSLHAHFDGHEGCRVMVVKCGMSPRPVFLKDGDLERFYIRTGPSTTELRASQTQEYVKQRFKV